MKKILVIAIIMIASVNLMNAQISFGVKAGLNLANVSGIPSANESFAGFTVSSSTSMAIGFHLGGICNIPLSDNFAISPELLYSTGGFKETITESGSFLGVSINQSASDNVSLGYIQIPILAKYSLDKDGGFNFSAGPYIGILVSASDSAGSVSSSCNTIDIGLAFGVGYQLGSGLGFGVRYNLGLTDIFKSYTTTDTSTGVPISVTQPGYGKNGVIAISVSYMFGMGK
jgi:hypothetical protein